MPNKTKIKKRYYVIKTTLIVVSIILMLMGLNGLRNFHLIYTFGSIPDTIIDTIAGIILLIFGSGLTLLLFSLMTVRKENYKEN